MDNEQAMLRYMLAYLRVHVAHDMSQWTRSQVIETFCTLPRPTIQPAEWAMRCGLQPQQEQPQQPKGPDTGSLAKTVLLWAAMHGAKSPKQQEQEPCQQA